MLSANIWRDGLSANPQSEPARRFETLRERRVEVRRETRDAHLAAEAARTDLERAERAARIAKAQHAAVGGDADTVSGALETLAAAEAAAEHAEARNRDALDALAWLDHTAERFVHHHAPELLGELADAAEQAHGSAVDALHAARAAVAAWHVVARRQEATLQAGGGPYRDVRAPVQALHQLTDALAAIEANLPNPTVDAKAAA